MFVHRAAEHSLGYDYGEDGWLNIMMGYSNINEQQRESSLGIYVAYMRGREREEGIKGKRSGQMLEK